MWKQGNRHIHAQALNVEESPDSKKHGVRCKPERITLRQAQGDLSESEVKRQLEQQ